MYSYSLLINCKFYLDSPGWLILEVYSESSLCEKYIQNPQCVKSVQIWSYFWSVFSRIRTKYGPEITPYLDTFRALPVNRFHVTGLLRYPLKTSENLWFSDVFRVVSKETSGMKRVKHQRWSFFGKLVNGCKHIFNQPYIKPVFAYIFPSVIYQIYYNHILKQLKFSYSVCSLEMKDICDTGIVFVIHMRKQ